MLNLKKINTTIYIIVFVFILWGSFFKLKQGSVISGEWVLQNKPIFIESSNNGRLQNIFVTEGEYVNAGDVLFEFESDDALKELEIEINYLENIENKLLSYKESKKNLLLEFEIVSEKIKSFEQLEKEGFVSKMYFIEYKTNLNKIKGQIINIDSMISEANTNINISKSKIEVKKRNLEKLRYLSPSDGYIKKIFFTNNSEFIQTGSKVIELSSHLVDDFIILASTSALNINKLTVGKSVYFKFQLNNDLKNERFGAEVTYISPDKFDTSNGSLYEIKLIATDVVPNAKPGTQVLINIDGEDETFFEYIFRPIRYIIDRSFIDKDLNYGK